MRQTRPGKRDGHIMRKLSAAVDHAIMHIRRMFGVVEKQQLAGAFINLRMRRNAVQRHPRRNALLLQRFGVEHIAFPALVESGHSLARVHDDVGA